MRLVCYEHVLRNISRSLAPIEIHKLNRRSRNSICNSRTSYVQQKHVADLIYECSDR